MSSNPTFVKSMDLFGNHIKQIPCIVGEGSPTESTYGAVGMLYMDSSSNGGGEMYKCVKVEDSKYTWEKLVSKDSGENATITDGSITPEKTTFFETAIATVPGTFNGVNLDMSAIIDINLSDHYGKWVAENWFYVHYSENAETNIPYGNGLPTNHLISCAISGKPYFRIATNVDDQYYTKANVAIYGSASPNVLTEADNPVTKCTINTAFIQCGLPDNAETGGVLIAWPAEEYPYYYIRFGGARSDTKNHYEMVAAFDETILDDPLRDIESGGSSYEYMRMREDVLGGYYKNMFESEQFQAIFHSYFAKMAPAVALPQTYGKSYYAAGDSLHAYSGGGGPTTSGFLTDINKHLGFTRIVNAGYAGSTWSGVTGGGGIKRITDLIAAGKAYDVVTLAWGTNAEESGTIGDEASNAEGATMVAAMKWGIPALRAAYPKTAIGVVIPPPKGVEGEIDSVADLMVQVCELLHVPHVDMRQYVALDDLGSDKVHLASGGACKYGAALGSFVRTICPYGDPL